MTTDELERKLYLIRKRAEIEMAVRDAGSGDVLLRAFVFGPHHRI